MDSIREFLVISNISKVFLSFSRLDAINSIFPIWSNLDTIDVSIDFSIVPFLLNILFIAINSSNEDIIALTYFFLSAGLRDPIPLLVDDRADKTKKLSSN